MTLASRQLPYRWAPLLVGLVALALAALPTLRHGPPRPTYHDELSYLLAADTFAHGRLSNPPHPMWRHFETFYVLQQPRYASKYPPGQGLLLAVGQLLWAPIVGVWLGVAALAAATVWMLRGFVTPRWALFGGLLVTIQLGLRSYWSESYWGGALAACGGALVFGALPRIVRRRPGAVELRQPLLLGLGLMVLANTRPFEGALVALAAAPPLVRWLLGSERRRERWRGVGLPLGLVLAAGLAAIGGYDRAVTGDPLTMPFALYDRQYHVRRLFVGQPLRAVPEYRHELLRRYFAGVEVHEIEDQRTLAGWARLRLARLERTRSVLLGPILTLPLLLLPWVWRERGVGVALGGVGMLLLAVGVTQHHFAHYAAPALPLLVLLAVQGWRWVVLRVGRRRLRPGLAAALVLALALVARLAIPDPVLRVGAARSANRAKESVENYLEREGGRHLVLVRHGRYSDVHDEWVANGADIDSQRLVWARAMSEADDAELRAYYPDRRAWRVEIAVERPGVIDLEEVGSPAAGREPALSGAPEPRG